MEYIGTEVCVDILDSQLKKLIKTYDQLTENKRIKLKIYLKYSVNKKTANNRRGDN